MGGGGSKNPPNSSLAPPMAEGQIPFKIFVQVGHEIINTPKDVTKREGPKRFFESFFSAIRCKKGLKNGAAKIFFGSSYFDPALVEIAIFSLYHVTASYQNY